MKNISSEDQLEYIRVCLESDCCMTDDINYKVLKFLIFEIF